MQPGRTLGATWRRGVFACALACGSIGALELNAQVTPVMPVPAREPAQQVSPNSNQQKLETSQQTNDRIRALSASAARHEPEDYVIGPGDVISIQVFDVSELTREMRVSQTGSIGLPLIPVRLHVAGLTETQTEQKIAEVLEANGLVSHPDVSVAVRERKSRPITVVGAVSHPLVYQADRQVTLVEVLAEAGGLGGDAGDTVIITRQQNDATADSSEPPEIGPEDSPPSSKSQAAPGPAQQTPGKGSGGASGQGSATGSTTTGAPPAPATVSSAPAAGPQAPPDIPPPIADTITINLNQILERGDMSSNIVLQPGDVVTVPHAGVVYALGSVSRPGGFVVGSDRRQLTTLKLLALAGGFTSTARSDHAVIIRRDSNGQQSEVPVNLKNIVNRKTEDVQLEPSDILYVPRSAVKITLVQAAELGVAVGTAVLIYRLIP